MENTEARRRKPSGFEAGSGAGAQEREALQLGGTTTIKEKKLVPAGALAAVWTSPGYNHCMFTARPGLEPETRKAFEDALYAMSFDNPRHRPVLEAEGLKKWIPAQDGYHSLRAACREQKIF